MLGKQIINFGDRKSHYYSNKQETAMVVRSAFGHFKGEIEQSPYLRIALNLGGGGIIRELSNNKEIQRNWRKNSIYLGLGEQGAIDCPPVEVLALAINLDVWREQGLCNYHKGDFIHMLKSPPTDNFVSCLLKALWESASVFGADTDFFIACCLQILDRLSNKQSTEKNKVSNRKLSKAALSIVDQYIEKQMEHRISIAELAACIKMEEASFARAFTHTKGQTPFAYITSLRIRKAQQYLKSGSNITSTAISIGYSNPSKFAAAFRRYTGKSPSEWRRSLPCESRP